MKKTKIFRFIQTRTGFFCLLVVLFWLKYIFAAYCDFNLGLTDPYQHFIMWLSPLGSTIIIISLGFYFSQPKVSYIAMLVLDFLATVLLFSNILYYRQFSDFLTVKTIANVGRVSQGLGKSATALLSPTDIFIWLDLIAVIALLLLGKIKIDKKAYGLSTPFAISSVGVFFLSLNMFLAESSRPRLLRNTFDRSYVVKYLGLNTYTVYDGLKNAKSTSATHSASSADLQQILNFNKQNYTPASTSYFGKERGKNVIIIHLESFQQFLIGLKINGKEVTPFLNSLYHNKHTLAFSNFYHQVGLGRTSDAENILETGSYGIADGSLFTSLGSEKTFQAAPQILKEAGYQSAVFHGNVGTFWNRNDVYKNLGYDYFFDNNYFSQKANDRIGFGIKDKLLFAESIKYLEQMQQPFYVKYLTVTNHIPFDMDKEDLDPKFRTSKTNDQTINNYFQTAHYLDQSVHEFFNYLRISGLEKNSMIVLYGDHYGLSNSENTSLAPLINKNADTWSDYDDVEMQRVPFMIHANNLKGGIHSEIGGEIDVLPTLLHLLGIRSKQYIQFGSDLLSPEHRDYIVFRNGTIVSPDFVIIGGKGIRGNIYDPRDGKEITHFTPQQKEKIRKLAEWGKQSLHYSDLLNNHNLLRYYTPLGFTPVNPNDYDYMTNFQRMLKIRRARGLRSSSLYSRHHGTTTNLYRTDAVELLHRRQEITQVAKSILNNQLSENKNKN